AAPARLRKLNKTVPRDLETIVHKAVDRDSARRYQTASDLAADLQRFIDDEPIRARPLSPVERLGRWCRRNPVVAGLTAAVACAVLVGTMVSIYYAAARAHNAELQMALEETARATEKAEQYEYALRMNLAKANWENGNAAGVLELLNHYR